MAAAPAEEVKLQEKPQGEEEDMELVNEGKPEVEEKAETASGNGDAKRAREDGGEETNAVAEVEDSKRQKVDDKSIEEERIERLEGAEVAQEKEEVKDKPKSVSIGPKNFSSSVEMFDYFYKFLHNWAPYLDLNKYEHTVLLELLKKGHAEPSKKIGQGVQSFQVRFHPVYKSRCFFIVRADGTTEDFSFRKCVDAILPLPENMKAPTSDNKAGGRGGGRGGGGRGGRGRGGRGGFRR